MDEKEHKHSKDFLHDCYVERRKVDHNAENVLVVIGYKVLIDVDFLVDPVKVLEILLYEL